MHMGLLGLLYHLIAIFGASDFMSFFNNLKGSRARALYKAGLRTPLSIAEASISEIAKALFESSSWAGQGECY